MEEKSEASDPRPSRPRLTETVPFRPFRHLAPILPTLLLFSCAPASQGTLSKIHTTALLRYGSDKEGGGPYAYLNPHNPNEVIGFEVDLMKELAGELGPSPTFTQGPWDRLLQNLDNRHVDVVINGYEWTENRAHNYLATRPYYVYQLQLMARRGGPIKSWDDLLQPKPDGKRWQVGVLTNSAGDFFAQERGGPHVEVRRFDGATDAMTATVNGQIDATLQDLPAVLFYRTHYPKLALAGAPVGRGYYVIYVRRGDEALHKALNRGLGRLIESGALRRIYEKYGVWTEAQNELAGWDPVKLPDPTPESEHGWPLISRYAGLLLDASLMTIFLSVTSMPLAMALGLLVALGRLYGPLPLRLVLAGYVEVLRGTPLMLQLYVLFYLLKLPALVAGIGGLAINYSAYEAEIYRAGLQAIPTGQMEAALALGMSRRMALRRVIVPQAVRIVIPPVTNDFIALFKDTSVCSVITLVELTKQYSILANSTGGVVEFAIATALLYMAMSVPLSWLSRWSERRLGVEGAKGGVVA
jgi:polar amino acid transport system substrate-binding protein